MLTVVYTVNGREFKHSGRGESFTRFLRSLDADGVKWVYAPAPTGSNLFTGVKLAS